MLSYGADAPPRGPRTLLVGVAAAGLVLGLLAGTRLDLEGADAPSAAAAGPAAADEGPADSVVAAGVVTPATTAHGAGFEVPVFNSGAENVTATVVALPGWAPPLTDTRATTIAPASWGVLRFSAPPDCLTYPAEVRVVHVRIWTDAGAENRIVPLSRPARALRARFDRMCDPPPTR